MRKLFFLVLVLIPVLAIYIETNHNQFWNSRLWLPTLGQTEVDRHTPLYTSGFVLADSISTHVTLTPDQNPIILNQTITIRPGASLTLQPGVWLVASEFSQIINYGTLNLHGRPDHPITLTTNEAHPDNQVWGGLSLKASSQTTLSFVDIQYAHPDLTCQPETDLTLDLSRKQQAHLSTLACIL